MNYQEVIKENIEKFEDNEMLENFLNAYFQEGDKLDDHEQNISEFIDNIVPVYNYDIVKEWQEKTECHELTIEVSGKYNTKDNIYGMMRSDLFFYYDQKLMGDFNKLSSLMDKQ